MNGTLVTKKLSDGLWTFNEAVETGPQVDAYLITGKDRALVIDSLMDERSLYKAVREITDLPLDLVVTHGHPDHAGDATADFVEAGCNAYINPAETPLVEAFGRTKPEWFKPLPEGMCFDLGDRRLEVILVAGHTPGSAVLLDRENQLLFTGDAIGAGVFWMHVDFTLPLQTLLESLEKLKGIVSGMDKLKIHPGHRHQAPEQLTGEFLDDVILMTRKIISGEWSGRDAEMTFGDKLVKYKTLSYKLMTDYCYNPQNL